MKPILTAALTHSLIEDKYAHYANDQWVKLLRLLGINRHFIRAHGEQLLTEQGETFLDFLSGYGVYNIGHNHPRIISDLVTALHSNIPSMLQSHVPTLAAELAERLIHLAGGKAEKVFFTNSGSEGVETVIKFARVHTRRDGILYAKKSFHGLTCGALSLMDEPFWRANFGPLLPNTKAVSFGDIAALEVELATKTFAAFIVEPIQGEAGVVLPSAEYLAVAQKLCSRYGTLFVLDEVQTGLFRTGSFLAGQLYGVTPDMTVIAKALSGGQVPVGAVLMTDEIHRSVYSNAERAFVHSSTFGENALAMQAGLTTLAILEDERLGDAAREKGEYFRNALRSAVAGHELVREVRGVGMFNAVEFQAPKSTTQKLLFKGFASAHPGLFGQMVVKTLFEEFHILTQMSGNNYMVIKLIPPLTIERAQLDYFVRSFAKLLEIIDNQKTKFWSQGLGIAARALRS